jgi:hypothetical protein
MKVNKYRGKCTFCNGTVRPNAGHVWRVDGVWLVGHIYCIEAGSPQVDTITFSSGASFTRNVRGRCEDAPCCGCCTI